MPKGTDYAAEKFRRWDELASRNSGVIASESEQAAEKQAFNEARAAQKQSEATGAGRGGQGGCPGGPEVVRRAPGDGPGSGGILGDLEFDHLPVDRVGRVGHRLHFVHGDHVGDHILSGRPCGLYRLSGHYLCSRRGRNSRHLCRLGRSQCRFFMV